MAWKGAPREWSVHSDRRKSGLSRPASHPLPARARYSLLVRPSKLSRTAHLSSECDQRKVGDPLLEPIAFAGHRDQLRTIGGVVLER